MSKAVVCYLASELFKKCSEEISVDVFPQLVQDEPVARLAPGQDVDDGLPNFFVVGRAH